MFGKTYQDSIESIYKYSIIEHWYNWGSAGSMKQGILSQPCQHLHH